MSLPDALLIPENKNSFADNDEEKRMAGSELENDRAKNDSSNLRRRSVLELGVLFMAAIALGNVLVLRRKLFTIASSYKPGEYGNSSRRKWDGSTHSTDGGRSTRTQRVWPEHLEDEMRKERIRRMQEAFYREKMRYAGSYEKWHDQRHAGWNARNDWEKKTREDRGTGTGNDSHVLKRPGLLHHYQVLGLDAKRHSSYSEAEIKAAFRARAMEHHPDRNMSRKEESELKFKEVLEAYDALRAWHRSKT